MITSLRDSLHWQRSTVASKDRTGCWVIPSSRSAVPVCLYLESPQSSTRTALELLFPRSLTTAPPFLLSRLCLQVFLYLLCHVWSRRCWGFSPRLGWRSSQLETLHQRSGMVRAKHGAAHTSALCEPFDGEAQWACQATGHVMVPRCVRHRGRHAEAFAEAGIEPTCAENTAECGCDLPAVLFVPTTSQ